VASVEIKKTKLLEEHVASINAWTQHMVGCQAAYQKAPKQTGLHMSKSDIFQDVASHPTFFSIVISGLKNGGYSLIDASDITKWDILTPEGAFLRESSQEPKKYKKGA
jgi:hypothetical protein